MFNKILELMNINKQKIKTFFSSKEVLIFLFFLILSFAFWYLNSLRKTYEVTVPVSVIYTDIPYDKINEEALPKTIQISVKDAGSTLLGYKIKKIEPITLNLSRVATVNATNLYVSNASLLTIIRAKLHYTTSITKITPFEIAIPVVEKSEKSLPIKYRGKITFAQQHSLSDSIKIAPHHVVAYGDKNIIDTLQYAYTEVVNFEKLKDTVRKDIPLQKIQGIHYEADKVNIYIPVETYTEKTLEIPVIGINFPADMELKTFPAAVNVSFFVTFSKYHSITESNFTAIVDYKDIIDNKTGKYKPVIQTNTHYVSNIRSNPAEIEYIMEQK